jgi:hypothetical protein
MLPTLFTQELGGGLFCQMVGRWLRENHVNALIYPSVRSNAAVDIHDGTVVGWTSWNLVDYRDSDAPSLRFLDTTNFWEDQVRVGPGLAVVPAPESNPYESVQVEYVDSGPREGSWRVRGLVAVRRAALAAQQEVYVKYGVDESGLDLTWVDDLSFEPYVRSWVKLFVSHSYGHCVRRGMELLPTIESFEVFHMFLLSLQRSGDEQVTPDLSAAKVLALLSPQVLSVHEHDREMHRLFRITLGVTNPRTELIREQDRVARCRINYYAAACLISQGRHGEAFGHLEACIEEPGEGCLEAHLALAHRTYDYPNGPGL